jgi:hypothetical protein
MTYGSMLVYYLFDEFHRGGLLSLIEAYQFSFHLVAAILLVRLNTRRKGERGADEGETGVLLVIGNVQYLL